jgi:hypothetical protein
MDERKPTEQIGGTTPDDSEVEEKGPWAAKAQDGIVPAEQGGSDAPAEMQSDDPELGSSVLGRPAPSGEPATEIDLGAGDQADAVTDGGPDVPDDVEPDLKDATAAPRQVDADSVR